MNTRIKRILIDILLLLIFGMVCLSSIMLLIVFSVSWFMGTNDPISSLIVGIFILILDIFCITFTFNLIKEIHKNFVK